MSLSFTQNAWLHKCLQSIDLYIQTKISAVNTTGIKCHLGHYMVI